MGIRYTESTPQILVASRGAYLCYFMKKSKVLSVLIAATVLLGYSGVAFAYNPLSYQFDYTDSGGPNTANVSTPTLPSTYGGVFGINPTTGEITYLSIGPNSGLLDTGTGLTVSNLDADKIIAPNGNPLGYWITNELPFTYVSTSTYSSGITNLQSQINSISTFDPSGFFGTSATNAYVASSTAGLMSAADKSSVTAMVTLSAQINANLFGTSTTMTAQAASTTNGLITQAQSDKLDAMSANLPWSWGTTTRSIVTGTGATGFQVSSGRVSTVHYNVKVTTTASIAGNADGYVALEVAPTNSATAGDWVEMGRCGNSQALTLAITLQSVQGTTCQLNADIPTGYYAKLRSVTTTGTVSFAFVSSSEVLK